METPARKVEILADNNTFREQDPCAGPLFLITSRTTMTGRRPRGGVVMNQRGRGLLCWVLSLAFLFGVVTSTTNPDDIIALQVVRKSFVDYANSLSSWNAGDPCDDGWAGVYCVPSDYPSSLKGSNLSYVTELRLMELGLHGNISSQIENLAALKYLNLMWNYLSGSIPTAIGAMKNLQYVLLSGNKLSGNLPRELGFLPNLVRLQVDQNNLQGPIPDTFAYPNLGNIQHVQLSNNSLDGSIPVAITNLTTLEYLFLDSNNFTGSLPSGVFSLSNLVIFQLDNNNFNSSIPAEYGTNSNLVRLSMRNCNLSGAFPDPQAMSSLAVMDLSHNSLTGSLTNVIFPANLTDVDLSYNSLSGSVPASLGLLNSLQILELRGNDISGILPTNLGGNPQQMTTIFDFQDNSITGAMNLQAFNTRDGSSSLWLSGNPFCNSGGSPQNVCAPKALYSFLLNQEETSPPLAFSQDACPTTCSAPYAVASSSQSNDCWCAVPINVQWQLLSPSFVMFAPYVQQFTTYLATGLSLDATQVQVQNCTTQVGDKLLCNLQLFPSSGAQFDPSESARIYALFANWKIPTSALFGPYNLISFSVTKVSTGSSRGGGGGGLSTGVIVGIVVGVVAFVVLKTLCMFYVLKYYLTWRTRRTCGKKDSRYARRASTIKKRSFSSVKVSSVKEFTIEEIAMATDNFSEDRLVGEGGYGKVYSGVLEDGQKVAVKRAEVGSFQGSTEFETEIELLSRVHHRNLVALVGYCNDDGEQVLVYEFVAYGSLLWHLSPASRVPLTFLTRLQIALDSARGICYLHTQADPPIYHRDVKASNILLDEKFHAKVSDFGLSKLAPQPDLLGIGGHVSTVVKGTPGYLDPEYFKTHRLTDKSDVYSFGVVLLVLMTGQQPIQEGKNLVRELNIAYDNGALSSEVDVGIRGSYSHRSMDLITRLALTCCRDKPEERPTITEVVAQLEELWKDTYCEKEDGASGCEYSGDLRNDTPKSTDSFFEIDPSKTSSPASSTAWRSNGQPDSSGNSESAKDQPNPINIVAPR